MSRYSIEPSSLMLSEAELSEVSSQLTRFAKATKSIQAFVSSVTIKLRIVTPYEIRHGIDQRIGALVTVRYDSGYNVLREIDEALNASQNTDCEVQSLFADRLADTALSHACILNEWILRDLANGQSIDVIEKVNSVNKTLAASVVLKSEQPTVFFSLTYTLNGTKEIRAGIDGYSPDGQKHSKGVDYAGTLVERESNINILEAVIDALQT